MFTTKVNVEKMIQKDLQRLRSEKERNLHGYRIGKLYYNCGEYELARRYVSGYLTVAPDSAPGHRLLAECLEKLNRPDAALKSYRTSLELNLSQKELLLKICELMASSEVSLDESKALYWCEQAQHHYPNHPTLFSLRERIVTSDKDGSNDEVEKLILSELEQCPTDVGLRIRLLQHLLRSNKISDAYKHAYEIEQLKYNIFSENLTWYETVGEILTQYQRDNSNINDLSNEFWIFYVSVLDKIASLQLDEQSATSIVKCKSAIFNFDQILYLAVENVKKCSERNLTQEFTIHYHGQLCLHLATLHFKKAKIDKVSFKEASRLNIPLLLAAWSSPPAEMNAGWLNQSSDSTRKWIRRWNLEANFRASQSGHILLSILGERPTNFSDKLVQICSGNWRERLFKLLFVTREQLLNIKTSYFITCPQLSELRALLPSPIELTVYDESAQLYRPTSLHHLVWLVLNNKFHEFKCNVFNGLQYSINNLNNCAAETLNVLDIQAFVYCAAACARIVYQETRAAGFVASDKPPILPVSITEHVCTPAQENWYRAAYKVYENVCGSELGSLRLTLTNGIEVIRCVGNHGLNVNLLVLLANTFSQHEKVVKDVIKKEFLSTRATLYWKNAIPLLERLKNNQTIKYPSAKKTLFDYRDKEFTLTEINQHLEDGKLYLACKLKEQHDYERALEMFQDLKSPYATFNQAQIYKALAAEQIGQNRENVTSEMRSQHIIFLSKARDCFYLTLDRLKEPSIDRRHPLNSELGTEIENIESLLSRIDPDICTNQNECENISDENISSVGSMGDHIQVASAFGLNYSNGNGVGRSHRSRNINQSTPFRHMPDIDTSIRRTEARPSPERLEAQIRQMSVTKDTFVTHILEQNRLMLDSYRSLSEEIRNLKDEIRNLKEDVKSTSTQKMQEDLASIKECLTDQIPMIKKEISELKKDTTKLKSNQLNDEDLYDVLEDDYDYNIQAAAASNAFNQSPLYSGFTARPPINYPAAPMYTGVYPPTMYGYHPALTGALPYGDSPQMPDFRNISLNQASLTSQATGAPLVQTVVTVPPPLIPSLPLSLQTTIPSLAVSSLGLTTKDVSSPMINPQNNVLINKAPPVNVVITASDPVPTVVTTSQPVLSVTIPPQHLKGNIPKATTATTPQQPHSYQISLPSTVPNFPTFSTTICPTTTPMAVTTVNLLSNVAPPIYSSLNEPKTESKSNLFATQSETLQKSLFGTSPFRADLNVSANVSGDLDKSSFSTTSFEEHDPCPDFKPIIPLPDEVVVKTGEEDEEVLFKERAKLFRYVDHEWKERGVGDIKLLHDVKSGKVRLLMRRDQIHKICANHFLSTTMELSALSTDNRAYVWAANDFADEEVRLEKLCVRFKTPEEGQKFYDEFENAKKLIKGTPAKDASIDKQKEKSTVMNPQKSSETSVGSNITATSSLGGFTFSSTPIFEPKKTEVVQEEKQEVESTPVKTSPFAGFSFKNTTPSSGTIVDFKPLRNPNQEINNSKPQATEIKGYFSPKAANLQPFAGVSSPSTLVTSGTIFTTPKTSIDVEKKKNTTDEDTIDEFVPTAEFNPVIPLPDLVEVKTGEEDEKVLFCERSKLFRFDSENKQWKERGLGEMKILQSGIVRLLMRREQVLKICCNHQVTKTMKFMKVTNNEKLVSWAAQDYSENELKDELFQIRFKTPEIASQFIKTLEGAQKIMDSGNFIEEETTDNKVPENVTSTQTGWGDLFKPKSGHWECKACYTSNKPESSHCIACENPKDDSVPKKEKTGISFAPDPSAPKFTFGIPLASTTNETIQKPVQSTGWGDLFKPKAGQWECKACYTSNKPEASYCVACENPKDDSVPKKEKTGISFATDPSTPKFTFGIPPAKSTNETLNQQAGWGDQFKPKSGSWECKVCYVSNDESKLNCLACYNPKDGDTSTAKSTIKDLLKSDNTTPKFTFGISPQTIGSIDKVDDTLVNPIKSWADEYKPKAGSWSCKSCYISNESSSQQCIACSAKKDGSATPQPTLGNNNTPSKFSFGVPQNTATTPISIFGTGSSTPLQADWSFLNDRKEAFDFQFNKNIPVLDNKNSAITDKSKDGSQYTFGSPDKFEFVFTPRSPRKSGGEESDGNVTEDEGEHLVFAPIIPLPDKIDVKTGEEDEDVLYCHRAKLFIYATGEWKERGLGDVKILRHKESKKLRVVMRRDQVLKICLNHILTKDIEYFIKDDKSWLFSAPDFSEGQIEHRQFCIRFKSSDIANEFKKAVDEALKLAAQTEGNERCEDGSGDREDTDSGEVILISPQISPELIQKAKDLMLPPLFYAYLEKPPCKGCIGCDPDSYVFKETETKETDKSLETYSFSKAFSSLSSPDTNKIKTIFGGTPSKEEDQTLDSSSQVKSIFGSSKNTTFGTANFSFGSSNLNSSLPTNTSNIFSGINSSNSQTNIFSGKNLQTPVSTSVETMKTPLFGQNNQNSTTYSFGSSLSSNIFSTPTMKPESPAVGTENKFNTSASVFGTSSTPIFSGTSTFNSKATTIFGGHATQPLFGDKTIPTFNDLNKSTNVIFAKADSSAIVTSESTPKADNITTSKPEVTFGFKTDSPIDFATLSQKSSVFGGSTIQPIFGDKTINKSTSVFGKTESPTVVKNESINQNQPAKVTDGITSKPETGFGFKTDALVDFASLAQNTSQPGFSLRSESYQFEGAGTPVFASLKKTPIKNSNENDESNVSTQEDGEENDPHFEPIIPMPVKIDLRTGEEDEEILFCERAKLYRYDTKLKEWKERGVGDMKILYHPQRKTYRLLLRREQIHKLVLNQLLCSIMEFKPLKSSDNAFCWGGYNFCDDGEDGGVIEEFAIRFKNRELAEKFCNTIIKAKNELAKIPAQIPVSVEEKDLNNEEGDDYNEEEWDEDEEEEDCAEEGDDDDEYDKSVVWEKHCILSSSENNDGTFQQLDDGDIQIIGDTSSYLHRIFFAKQDGEVLTNTPIAPNVTMEFDKNICTWTAIEDVVKDNVERTLRAEFDEERDAEAFYLTFKDTLEATLQYNNKNSS